MCKFNKFNGKVTNYCSNMYVIEVDDKTIYIPFSVMHKFPAFPQSMMEDGHLKIGVTVTMVKKTRRHTTLTMKPTESTTIRNIS